MQTADYFVEKLNMIAIQKVDITDINEIDVKYKKIQ